MTYKNREGYNDPTAGNAIREADKSTEKVMWFIKMVRELADIVDLEVIGRIGVKDKKTGREYK